MLRQYGAHIKSSQSRCWKVSKDVRQRSCLVLATWLIKSDYSGSSYQPCCTGELVVTWSRSIRYFMDTTTPTQFHAYNSASIRVPEVTAGNCTNYSPIWTAESTHLRWQSPDNGINCRMMLSTHRVYRHLRNVLTNTGHARSFCMTSKLNFPEAGTFLTTLHLTLLLAKHSYHCTLIVVLHILISFFSIVLWLRLSTF